MKDVILGISAFGHDASSCIVNSKTGEVIFAIAEERLSNIKHDSHYPIGSLLKSMEIIRTNNFSLEHVALNFDEREFINGTLYSEINKLFKNKSTSGKFIKELLKLLDFSDYYIQNSSYSFKRISTIVDSLNLEKNVDFELINKRIGWYFNWAIKYKNIYEITRNLFPEKNIWRVKHHISHAAAAFFNSGFNQATVLIFDGQGESETISVFKADESGINQISHTIWPISLGIFYLTATSYLGYSLGDEYKVMGMSAYGKPKYLKYFESCFKVDNNAKLHFYPNEYLCINEFDNLPGHFSLSFTQKFSEILSPRNSKDPIHQVHYDLASSIQKLVEEISVNIASKAMEKTGYKNLAISGGVGLNGLINEKIRTMSGCKSIFIYPASGDDGCAIGAAQYVAYLQNKISPQKMILPYYGQRYEESDIKSLLIGRNIKFSYEENINQKIAYSLANGEVIARFKGRSEFGPRALGNRSILASPCKPEMKDILNLKIKHRESFRPFAPACLEEYLQDFFEIESECKYMLLIPKVKTAVRDRIPSVVHEDDTARVQSVNFNDNPDFYLTIKEFFKLTNVPVVINTSFNLNGETIVETPLDAIESFGQMDIDYLAIENFWISKKDNTFEKLTDKDYLELRKSRFRKAFNHPLIDYDISDFHYLKYNSYNIKSNFSLWRSLWDSAKSFSRKILTKSL